MYRTAYTNRQGLIVEDLAVICSHCGARLRIVQTRMALAQIALFVGYFGAAWGTGWLIAQVNKGFYAKVAFWVCGFLYLGLAVALWRRYVPHLVRLRPLRDDEIPLFPNPKTVAVISSYRGGLQ